LAQDPAPSNQEADVVKLSAAKTTMKKAGKMRTPKSTTVRFVIGCCV
jgi:hypothetical protein